MAADPDPADFVRLLEAPLRRAASLVRSLEGRVVNSPKVLEENIAKQALTAADTQAQECLLEALAEHFPGVALAAEEDTPRVARFATESEAVVVIDPIDGTLHSYLEGHGPYAVIVGLVLRGRYEAALLALPREGLLFGAHRGGGAFSARAGGPLRPVRASADGDRVLISHGTPAAAAEAVATRGFEVVRASGGAVSVAPLVRGVRAGLRHGSSPIGISIRCRVGALIAREAGAHLQSTRGAPFPEDDTTPSPDLLVSAEEADLTWLAEALKAQAK